MMFDQRAHIFHASVLTFLVATALDAEVTCSGFDCPKIYDDYGAYASDFQETYLPLLARDLLAAQAMAATSGIPYHVNLKKMAFGIYATGAYTDSQKIQIHHESKDKTQTLNERGFALHPNFYVGVNVGWLLTSWYSWYYDVFKCEENFECNSYYSFPILSRIDVYVYGIGKVQQNSPNDRSFEWKKSKTTADAFGTAVRLHLINEIEIAGKILSFSGVSLGGGYYKSNQSILLHFEDTFKTDTPFASDYVWSGNNRLDYNTQTKTSYGEIRSGIRVLSFLGLYAGMGIGYTVGKSDLNYERIGYFTTPGKNTEYTFRFNGNYEGALRTTYGIFGINLGPITVQGNKTINRNSLTDKHLSSITIGITHEF